MHECVHIANCFANKFYSATPGIFLLKCKISVHELEKLGIRWVSRFFRRDREIRLRLRTPNLSQEQLLLLGRVGDHECSFWDPSSRLFLICYMQINQVPCLMLAQAAPYLLVQHDCPFWIVRFSLEFFLYITLLISSCLFRSDLMFALMEFKEICLSYIGSPCISMAPFFRYFLVLYNASVEFSYS